jgi:hypothetical protein
VYENKVFCLIISNADNHKHLLVDFDYYNKHKSTALLIGVSWDRSPVVSLGIFSVASDNSMCPGSIQHLKMNTRILLEVKTAGAYA